MGQLSRIGSQDRGTRVRRGGRRSDEATGFQCGAHCSALTPPRVSSVWRTDATVVGFRDTRIRAPRASVVGDEPLYAATREMTERRRAGLSPQQDERALRVAGRCGARAGCGFGTEGRAWRTSIGTVTFCSRISRVRHSLGRARDARRAPCDELLRGDRAQSGQVVKARRRALCSNMRRRRDRASAACVSGADWPEESYCGPHRTPHRTATVEDRDYFGRM
jgi:hypothetical protein